VEDMGLLLWLVNAIVVIVLVLVWAIKSISRSKSRKPSKNEWKIQENDSKPSEIEENPSETERDKFQYRKKSFLTASEKSFLATLSELNIYNLIVVPQVNLATVILKTGEVQYHTELFRNIDFGVFDKEYNLLLLIELNDPSHLQNDRRERDQKVKKIIEKADLKLMTFWTDKPNKPEYVIPRILEAVKIHK
jgi:hypothetical protein